ncbi:helix-turn-helix domain-containing protein [Leptospira sp. GIMC2001]|uniref:helix-turn-helix domain-containing protein n=1 Tax=Leptospira sp. GIMC2001 TaxID=1513297 RepID=UPI002349521A|nr:helix-turn-helix domain-containing protein [Leptospira sp. GIMC2001]WCL47676.1 helix-turn-helix domain-containing protein [Leptospira sp. GIMC2001]
MSEHQPYIRIMTDVIDSGVWALLSSSARTLYPVLLKFSDFHFKPVWPNTETLMGLTGFKTKKSIVEAKRDLEKHGLIHTIAGSGRKSTKFYFLFDYEGSKITPLGDTGIPHRVANQYASGDYEGSSKGVMDGTPNHIKITINNNQHNRTKESGNESDDSEFSEEKKQSKELSNSKMSLASLLEDFGADVFYYAYREAEKRGLHSNLQYLKAICKNRVQFLQDSLKNGQYSANRIPSPVSWKGFLEWAESHLSTSSANEFKKLDICVDGSVLCVNSSISIAQKSLIERYFSEEAESNLTVVFASPKVENRIF